jgi:hypothetical protein
MLLVGLSMEADTRKALKIPTIQDIQCPKINKQRRDPSQKMNYKHIDEPNKQDTPRSQSKTSNIQAHTGLIIAHPRQSTAARGQ